MCEESNHDYYVGAVNQVPVKVEEDKVIPRAESMILYCKKCGKVLTLKINYGGKD